MKNLREFTDDPDKMILSVEHAIRRIEKLPLPYTGNKKKLAFHIYDALQKHDVEFKTVLDAFTGSATVAYLFKLMGKRVIANDLLTSSYINAVAFVENPGIKLSEDDKSFLLKNQNTNKGTFVEDNYLGEEFRSPGQECRFNKFTRKECLYLDNFRANIDELCGIHSQSLGMAANAAVVLRLPFGNVDQSVDILKHRMKQQKEHGKTDRRIGIYYDDEYNLKFDRWFRKYVKDFTQGNSTLPKETEQKIKRANFLANLQQHVLRDCMVQGRLHRGQSLAEVDVRLKHQKNQLKASYSNEGSTEMDFLTQAGAHWRDGKPGQGMKWWTFAGMDLPGDCLATNMDVVELLKQPYCKVDCAYFDPPYGGQSSDYATMYRFLEEYIYGQKLEDLPHLQNNTQKFVKKRKYGEHFSEMLEAAKHIPIWLFSYNDNSWKDIEYICGVIREHRRDVKPVVLDDNYRYLYRKKQGRTTKSCKYLIIAR